MRMRFRHFAASGVFGLALFAHARATPAAFIVENPSFETDVNNSAGTGTVRGNDGSFAYPGNPPGFDMPGWELIGSVAGVYNPDEVAYVGAGDGDGDPTPAGGDGALIGFTRGSDGFYQNVGTIESSDVGSLTTLTAGVGDRAVTVFNGYTIEFRIGSDFASATPTGTISSNASPANGTFADQSTSFTPLAEHVGQSLFIRLQSNGAATAAGQDGATDFDNVRLTVVPEPAALGLLAFGALGMLRRRV